MKSPRLGRTGWVLLAFVLVMGIALISSGWDDAALVIGQLSVGKIAALLGLAALHYAIRAWRWHWLVRASGVQTRFSQNLVHLLGGFAMTATPGRLGELIRLRWLKKETGHAFTRLVPIAFADRAIELGSMLLLVLGVLAFGSLGTGSVWILITVTTGLVIVVCQPRLLEVCVLWLWQAVGHRKARLFAKLRRMIHQLRNVMRPTVLVPILVIGVLGWASEGIAFWLLLGWLDTSLPLATATAIFMVAILAGALSGLPGGLGGTEATGVALLVLQAVPFETAVLAILIIRVTTLWFAVLVGMIVLPVAEMRANKKWEEINAAA